MIKSRKLLLVTLMIPILALLALTLFKSSNFFMGHEVELPIVGYDPRDLLSGHYLVYRVDYGVANLCATPDEVLGFVCLDNRTFTHYNPDGCSLFIKGTCKHRRFEAGIDRFYIPEEKAAMLDQMVRGKQASIVISVTGSGYAQVKNLLLNGKPWEEAEK
jgi:uncharacterized membrane-anchored protein